MKIMVSDLSVGGLYDYHTGSVSSPVVTRLSYQGQDRSSLFGSQAVFTGPAGPVTFKVRFGALSGVRSGQLIAASDPVVDSSSQVDEEGVITPGVPRETKAEAQSAVVQDTGGRSPDAPNDLWDDEVDSLLYQLNSDNPPVREIWQVICTENEREQSAVSSSEWNNWVRFRNQVDTLLENNDHDTVVNLLKPMAEMIRTTQGNRDGYGANFSGNNGLGVRSVLRQRMD